VFRAPQLVIWGLALLIAEYSVTVLLGAGGAVSALVMAALLFVLAEGIFAVIDVPSRAYLELGAIAVQLATTGIVIIGAMTVDVLLLFGVSRAPAGSQLLTLIGAVSAVATLGILTVLHVGLPRRDGPT